MVYEPQEDSILLRKFVEEYTSDDQVSFVLEIGPGSGFLTVAAAKKVASREGTVVAADIDPEAVEATRKAAADEGLSNIEVVQSDLFENVEGKFDLIYFNPPYLPEDKYVKDVDLIGGKKGYETLVRFLDDVGNYLTEDGKVLILFSSLTNKDRIEESLRENFFEYECLALEKFSFEELYVYLLSKSNERKAVESKGITSLRYLAKGKRGLVYTGAYSGKKIAIKIDNPHSTALGRLENEANFLKKLNEHHIGPAFVCSGNGFLVYEFAEGEELMQFVGHASTSELLSLFKHILEKMYTLDQVKVNKEEMHHPWKHVLVRSEDNVTMIDFERCSQTINPKNVSQFVQCITSTRMQEALQEKGVALDAEHLHKLASQYKKSHERAEFEAIISYLASIL